MSRVVLVTGGSRGIGAATARLAARHGRTVCIDDRRDAVAAESVAKRIESEGGRAFPVRADIGDEAEVVRLFAAIDARFGHLGIGERHRDTGAAGGRRSALSPHPMAIPRLDPNPYQRSP